MSMPVHPVLMVLYTNDAVEVRYSDGSRLHILPCGTTFTYHVTQDTHPIHGMKAYQQRCRYATSSHKQLVLSALDFRNRFAERPYLSQDLLEHDQVVPLYARIKEIAWPKRLSSSNCEHLKDGGIRVTSQDQFGSLVLSPHGQDFTVCYLSLLSEEKKRETVQVKKNESVNQSGGSSEGNHSTGGSQGNQININHRNGQEYNRKCSSNTNSPITQKPKDELNISPITQASYVDSPQALSNASGSPITPQNVVKDDVAKYRPFSTPTRELEGEECDEPVCTPYGKTAVFRDYGHKGRGDHVTFGDKELQTETTGRNDSKCSQNREEMPPPDQCLRKGRSRSRLRHESNCPGNDESCRNSIKTLNDNSGHSERNDSGHSLISDSNVRCLYSWVTRHISCDECPVSWSPVVKLATEAKEKGFCLVQESERENHNDKDKVSHLRHIKKSNCVFSRVPSPLPLTCPGQHLHKTLTKQQVFSDDKDPAQDPSTFHLGRLKILLIDGVVYRIARLTSMKVVEVYPGDGSVLLSQGMSGQFFLHRILSGDKIEDRTYSLKSPPPSLPTANYSIPSLMKRAHRFLCYANQEERTMPASTELFCWKYEEVSLVEPLPCTILEDCAIPGYGKFSALSSGQIRIVFEDRTALDMTWDFSKRIQNCLEHSSDTVHYKGSMALDSKVGMCRLLLPSGQYQMVDIRQPGIYKRYVEMACEWGQWVNSSPSQRALFYKDRDDSHSQNASVQRELQKINCFNYIVDNTVFKKPNNENTVGSAGYQTSEPPERKGILRNTEHSNRNITQEPASGSINNTGNKGSHGQSSQFIHQTKSSVPGLHVHLQNQNGFGPYSSSGTSKEFRSREQLAPVGLSRGDTLSGCVDLTNGFNAVREALLRTSSVIKDIDGILDRKK